MVKKIVVFYGYKGSGKDTCYEIFQKRAFFKHNLVSTKLSFAELLRKVIWSLFKNKIGDREYISGSIERKETEIEGWEIPNKLREENNWSEKNWTGRRLLQWFGTDVSRTVYDEVWVEGLVNTLYEKESNFDVFGITDCRFPNEYAKLRDLSKEFDVHFVKIERNVGDNEFGQHESEKYIDTFEYDHIIHNNSDLDHLTEETNKLAIEILS
jgi:hypothetical protein